MTTTITGTVTVTSPRFTATASDGAVPVEVAEVDLILAVAAVDGTNTSWGFLTPTPGTVADGIIPAGWSAADGLLSGTGAEFATILAFGADDTITVLVPGGDAVGVWQFTPATIEDPWTPVLGTLVYAPPGLGNGLATMWTGIRNGDHYDPLTASAADLAFETFANDAALSSTDAVFSLCGTDNNTPHDDRAWTTPAPDVTFTTGLWHRSIVKVKPMYRVGAYDGELVFSELGTQTHDNENGTWDNFEPAIVRIWSEATQTWKNYPYLEVTVEGGTEETIRVFPNRPDNTTDPWPYTVELFTGWAIPDDTWVELGMDLDFTGADGNWRCRMLLRSLVTTPDVVLDDAGWRVVYACHGDFPGSVDSGVTEPWALGLDKGELLVPWVKIADGPSGTVFADPTAAAALLADPAGASPFTDDAGNEWTPSANAEAFDPTATSGGVALGETSTTAYRGDRGKTAYDHSQVVTGNPHGTTAADVGAQPVDSDLTAIAALTTTSYGRAFLALADAAAGRTALGLGTAATTAASAYEVAGAAAAAQAASQPLDSDLTAIAALTTTTFGRALLELANAGAARTALGLGSLATASTIASADITDGTIVAGDLAAAVSGRIPTTVVLGSDQASDTSATIANTTGLSFAVTSGTTYLIRGLLDVTGATAGDLRVSLTCPSGTVRLAVWGKNYASSATGADSVFIATIVASGGIATDMATITSQSSLVLFEGYFTASASGTFQMQHGQRSANATATTVKAGSYLTYHT